MTETEIKFAQDQIKLTKYLHSLPDKEHIAELCSMHGCSPKIQKLHAEQFLRHRWNSHPSERFVRWWMNRGIEVAETATEHSWKGVDAIKAFNCESVRECYRVFLREQRAEMREGVDEYIPLNEWDQTT